MTRSKILITRAMATAREALTHSCKGCHDRAMMTDVVVNELCDELRIQVDANLRLERCIHDQVKIAEAFR